MKRLLERKSKTLLVVTIFVVFSLFIVYYFLPEVISELNIPGLSEKSPFENVGKGDYTVNTEELQLIYSVSVDYWRGWTWEERMFFGQIRNIDILNSEMLIYVVQPKGQPFSGRESRAYVKCPLSKTISVRTLNPPDSFIEGGFDIFRKASVGDYIHGYCLDGNCLNVGRQCVLLVD